MIVRRSSDVNALVDCQLVFVSASEAERLEPILSALRGKPILSVGETEGFARGRGVVRMILVENHVRLRINLEAARRARLSISSKLLRQAEILEPGEEK